MTGLLAFRFFTKSYYLCVFSYVNENFSEGLIQVASAILSCSQGVGAIICTLFFLCFPDWRLFMIYYCGLPMVIISAYFLYYIYAKNFFPDQQLNDTI